MKNAPGPTIVAARRGVRVFHACPHDYVGGDAVQRAAAPAAGDFLGDSRQDILRKSHAVNLVHGGLTGAPLLVAGDLIKTAVPCVGRRS
jgi:hypothetical protein